MKTLVRLFFLLTAAMLNAAAAQNPIEAELFPPDFLLNQRESLGLTEDQLHAIQSIVGDAQPKFEALKGKLEQRVADLSEALRLPKPEVAQTEEKLRALLTDENEMKLLQLRLMLTLRNSLTLEQVTKARELRRQAPPGASGDPREGLAERLQKKFEQLRTALDQRAFGGESPTDLVTAVEEIQRLAQGGQPLEAERRIDALLVRLRGEKSKPQAPSTPRN
jgi:hypothetical protein